MITVEELIHKLSIYPKYFRIKTEQNMDFVHIVNTNDNEIILSTTKPIAYCNRTGSYIYPSLVEGYYGFCPELDEDVFEIETDPL